MCFAIEFEYSGNSVEIGYNDPDARLPILLKNNEVALEKWGVREIDCSPLPLGGWARLNSIRTSKLWKQWPGKPVKIAANRYLQKYSDGSEKWLDLNGKIIQGMLVKEQSSYVVYVVTLPPNDSGLVCVPRIINKTLLRL